MTHFSATNSALPVPFHIETRRLYGVGDFPKHEVRFGVVGVDNPATVIVVHDGGRDPRIIERPCRGSMDLSDSLLDALSINCFRLMYGVIVDQDGESGWWTLSDATPWIRKTMDASDADRVLRELSRHVKPGMKVQSACLVADDDAI